MRFAGTMIRYSNSAMPQLISAAIYHGELAKFFRCPYHANVMNRLDTASISAVTSSGFETRFIARISAAGLIYAQQFHIEQQRRIRWNRLARAHWSITQVRGDNQRALSADLHACHPLIPALDDAPRAERKIERLVAVARAVELLALVVGSRFVVQPSGVMHRYVVPCGCFGAFTQLGVGFGQFGHDTGFLLCCGLLGAGAD